MKRKLITIAAALMACVGFAALLSGSAQTVSAGAASTFAIRNARIVTVAGPVIENGTVVISDGKIADVGAAAAIPANAKVIDGQGLSVYPGLIDSGTEIGLTEISSVSGTVDTTEIGDNNANIHVDVSIRPDTSHVAVARVNGITTVLTEPRGSLIAGQSALINLDGWVPKEMLLKSPAAMHITWPGANAAGPEFAGGQGQRRNVTEARREQDRQVDLLKKIIRQARAYADSKEAREKDPSLPKQDVDLKLEALIPVVRGRLPVVILAVNERDIKNAIAFADEMKIKMILSGGIEAYKVAGELRAKNIPVLVGPVLRMPANEDDPYDAQFANAGILSNAGVKIAFQTLDSAHVRDLPYHAGMAAAFGLGKEEALKALTLYPAQIFGVADKIGSIEKGKIANVLVTDGDPLEILTQIKYLFIAGRQIPLTSRHTELYEKYKARP